VITQAKIQAVSGYNPPALRFAKRTPAALPALGASHKPAEIPREFKRNNKEKP
jgi:hypothetical protein